MRKIIMALAAVVGVAFITPCYANNNITDGEKVKFDTLSYALGVNIGSGTKQQIPDIDFDIAVAKQAIAETLINKSTERHNDMIDILREFFSTTLAARREAYEKALKYNPSVAFKPFVSDDERKKISFAFGKDIGCNILNANLDLQAESLAEGFEEGYNNTAKLSQEQAMAILQNYFMVVRPAEAAERSAKWLAKKEAEAGVQKTESGLLYKVIVAGDMTRVAKSDEDVVKVHYEGKLQNGKVFDASRFNKRSKEQQELMRRLQPSLFDEKGNILKEEPIEFSLSQVIKGWAEGMKLVGPGGKIILYIPAELAYGARGAGSDIGPNEALEFEVELIDVNPVKNITE